MNRPRDRLWLWGALGLLVATAVVRILVLGWDALAPDDARYLYVGLSVLDGHGAVTPAGIPYVARSPVYGILLALGGRALGGDVITGAHVAAWAMAVVGLLGAVLLAARLGGAVAAVVAALTLVAMPLPWALLSTLRVDQALGTLVVGLVLVASTERPRARRAAAAGAILGIGVLVKEAALPVAALPVAWAAHGWGRPWLGRAALFALVVVVVAGWWWLVVWNEAGVLFPLNALGVIDARQVDAGPRPGRLDVIVIVAAVVGGAAAWAANGARSQREPRLRPLVVAALGLLPAAGYALMTGLAERNYLPLALLTAVAIGTAAPGTIARIRSARLPPRLRRGLAAAMVPAVLIAVAAGQVAAVRPSPSPLPGLIAAEVRQLSDAGGAVTMPFRERETVALELFGRNPVRSVGTTRVEPSARPGDYVWLGLRDRVLFGITRRDWQAAVGAPDVVVLVIVVPHPLAPAELVPALERPGAPDGGGIRAVKVIEAGGSAHVFAVSPDVAAAEAASLPPHLDATAALAWLALGDGDALGRLADAGAVVAPDASLEKLRTAVAGGACLVQAGAGHPDDWLRLVPAGPGCAAPAP